MQFLQLTIIKFKRNARKGFPQSCNGFQIRAIFVATLLSNMLLKVCLYRIIIRVGRVPAEDTCLFCQASLELVTLAQNTLCMMVP